jgi:hypothetical protein
MCWRRQGVERIRSVFPPGYASAKKKFWKEGAVAMDTEEYMRSFKKGSKKFRQVLSYEAKAYDITKLTQVTTLARITNTTVP